MSPNILLLMVDQLRFPRFSYEGAGMAEPIKNILGLQGDEADLEGYAQYFPGFIRLRQNAVVLRNHTIASSACVPSRATITTGQYGTRTGVLQTDGIFKSGDANNYPWLQPDGIPTMGDWFRAAGYETHYFGKCHFANPPDHSLEGFGFSDWELSYPEPHGSSPDNLGIFRDHGFRDLVTGFLRRKGLGIDYDRAAADQAAADPSASTDDIADPLPWLAVASFTNPHDIAAYPLLTSQVEKSVGPYSTTPVPGKGAVSVEPTGGKWRIDLNPAGFPQDNATNPPTWNEDLTANKPDCQYEYAIKLGVALAAAGGGKELATSPEVSGLPFALTRDYEANCEMFMQYYAYVCSVVDGHIDAVLRTLDETGLCDDTIVVFVSDHGEYGAAHGGMMEKWHTAYQEMIHVPVVVSSPRVNGSGELRQIDALTSHIDLLPTMLGLAGFAAKVPDLTEQLRVDHDVPYLVGADLAPLIEGKQDHVVEPDGTDREAVLFMTDDMITEPLPDIGDPHSARNQDRYEAFLEAVEEIRTTKRYHAERLTSGSVCQPCSVRCVRDEGYKLVRYVDTSGSDDPAPDQWEMYDLHGDRNETTNLLVYDAPFPTLSPAVDNDHQAEVEAEAKRLRDLMTELEERMLSVGPAAYLAPSNGDNRRRRL